MKRTTNLIVATLGVAALLAGCSSKSPTAPKQPTPSAFSVTLTSDTSSAQPKEQVLIVAQVSSGGANVPDNTAVTFVSAPAAIIAGLDSDGNTVLVNSVVRTTTAGRASVSITAASAGTVVIEARVAGGSAQKSVVFQNTPGPTPTVGPISVVSISPRQGGMQGGDLVVITGNGFVQPLAVNFVVAGRSFPATVSYVSPDGGTMNVVTPNVAGTPPFTTDQPADVSVTAGPYAATLPGGGSTGFTYLAQVTTPQIYTLTPNAGPFEGGTQVVITGVGFQYPVVVMFGTRQAQVTSSNYTDIHCVAPSITDTQPSGPTPVLVTVTNAANGDVSNGYSYTYGSAMYISGIDPPAGPQDTTTPVTIFGQGFVSPVSITVTGITGVTSWNATTVGGTQIIATAAAVPVSARTCSDVAATITVTNLGSNTKSNPTGRFTYQAIRPLITSVTIDGAGNTLQQYVPGTCNTAWSSHSVTIKGTGFQGPTMNVRFGPVGPVLGTVVDPNTITLTLPDLNRLTGDTPAQWPNQVACNEGAGVGFRNVAMAVGVTVDNVNNGCSDFLGNAIIIAPCDTSCRLAVIPTLTVSSTNPVTVSAAGTLPTDVSFTISAAPAGVYTLDVATAGDFAFTGAPTTVTTNGSGIATLLLTVPSGVTNGQSATATISYLSATPAVATVNVGP